MIAASTTALELLQTLVIILGALGVVGSIVFGCVYTSIKATESSGELRLAERHEEGETNRHRATLDHQAHMKAAELESRHQEATRAIDQPEEGPPITMEPRRRRLRRAL